MKLLRRSPASSVCVLPCALIAVVFLAWQISSADDGTRIGVYKIPQRGSLKLSVPVGWQEKVELQGNTPPVTVTYRPKGGGWQLLVSAVWDMRDPTASYALDRVRATVEGSRALALKQAVEAEAPLHEISGATARGVYFSVTDKNPTLGPGDYRFMTQGMVTMDTVALTFTLLGNSADSDLIAQVAKSIGDARLDQE